jgi:hypothetical protein
VIRVCFSTPETLSCLCRAVYADNDAIASTPLSCASSLPSPLESAYSKLYAVSHYRWCHDASTNANAAQ